MSSWLSSTATSCSQAVRENFASASRSKVRTLGAFTSLTLIALAIACSDATQHPAAPAPSGADLPGPVFGLTKTGNGPGACLLQSAQAAGYINNVTSLNCTSEDVDIAFAKVTLYSINGAAFQTLNAGDRISCVPGDSIRAITSADIANNAHERYDFGLWINPNGSAYNAAGNACLHFNLVPGQNGSTSLDDTPDSCGDIASDQDTVTIPLDTLKLVCPGGGATTVSVDACAAWSNSTTGANDLVCPKNPPGGPDGYRQGTTPGTTAKCRCEPLVLPIDVKGVIRVQKQTLPDGSTQSFTFTPSYNSGSTFNLTDGQTNNSGPLSSGTYTVAETVPTGWALTNRECHFTDSATVSVGIGSVTNGVSVNLPAGGDITCVFTNTKTPKLTVNKICSPTTDAGAFNLQIDGSTAGSGANAACGGTTGGVAVTVGSHTVGETAGTNTSLSSYLTPVIGGACASNGSVTVAAGDSAVCTITNTRKPVLRVLKATVPTTDAGKFDFNIGGTGFDNSGAGYGNGQGTGYQVVSIGAVAISESGHTGTSLSAYDSQLSCGSKTVSSNTGISGSVTAAAGDSITCTFTNSRKPVLRVAKVTVPTTDAGKFDFNIGGTGFNNSGAGYGNGQNTGYQTVAVGAVAVSETGHSGTSLSSYSSALECSKTVSSNTGTSGSVTAAYGDSINCTFTNTRGPVLRVIKNTVPTNDAGRFDLTIGANTFTNSGAGFGNGGSTGYQAVTANTNVTVSEAAHSGTTLSNYTSTLECSKTVSSNTGTSGSVAIVAGDSVTCTFTNTRKPVLRVTKVTVPTSDAGKFDFSIGGSSFTNSGAGYGNAQNTGYQIVSVGSVAVSESGHSGTNLSAYSSVLECSKTVGSNTGTSGSVTAAAGDSINCTFTNTRLPVIRVLKATVPTSDVGKFDFTIGANSFDNSGAGYGNGQGTAYQTVAIGSVSVAEAAHSGTTLSNYTSSLSCGSKTVNPNNNTSGTVSAAAGDSITCTFTNSRNPVIRVLKATVPTTDPGKFDFTIGANSFNNSAAGYGNGQGTAYQMVAAGTVTVGETGHTGTTLSNYVSALSCGSKTVNPNNNTSGSVNAAYGDSITCTFTNSRKAVLIVDKVVTGGGPQLFDFTQEGISPFQLADATTPKKTVDLLPDTYTVCELALAVAWNLTVTKNGSSVTPSINGTTGDGCYDVVLNYGDSTTLVFTNSPPPGGGTRTIGYWKNWSSCAQSNGGQYDKAIAKGTPEATLDYNLPIAVSVTNPLGDLTALTCLQAINLLAKNSITGDKRAGDPIYNMVAQMLGARLNVAAQAGVCPTLTTALSNAQAFLDALNFNGTGSYKGVLSASDQNLVNGWAGIFGSYNEGTLGGGCPTHI